jgi:flagellar hook-basal body complex protein FliE
MLPPLLPAVPAIAPVAAPSMGSAGASGGKAFQSVLSEAIQKVESFQQNADASLNRFLSGEGEDLHKVALATQQADLSFQLFTQMRNKIVSAYQEVMRMQV